MLARLPRPAWVWLVLVLATILSFESSLSGWIGERVATTFILLVAVIKVRLVAMEFMELRLAPIQFRLGVEIWLVALFLTMVSLYLSAAN